MELATHARLGRALAAETRAKCQGRLGYTSPEVRGAKEVLCLDANAAAGYLAGELTPAEAEAVEQHIARCPACRVHLSELALSDSGVNGVAPKKGRGRPAAGERVARYVVVETLGKGGMGIVYRANDPELGRPVALKLLRPDGEANAEVHRDHAGLRNRLAREARTMAQLAHPNVVRVYDLGIDEGVLFVTMELIEGTSVARWLTQKPRKSSQILRVFTEAGKGLAAAHAAGVVHRDFKPDNVLIDETRGRVCVTDFGLARPGAADEVEAGHIVTRPSLAERITATGTRMGTPAYMSPEQHRGDVAGARSDQFSFCVALYEALYRESPFLGDTSHERAAAVVAGRRRPRPKDSPRSSIDDVLDRGMSTDPTDRYESIVLLLEALSPPPSRRLRVATAVMAVILAAGIGTTLVVGRRHADPDTSSYACSTAELRLAGIWDQKRKQAIQAAFEATDKPWALDAWRGAERSLDAYAEDWSARYASTCAAPPSDVTHLRRLVCLEERRIELQGFIDVLEHADAALVEHAVPASESLTRSARCSEWGDRVAPPATPELAAKVAGIRATLARGKALHESQSFEKAASLIEPALGDARATGYLPVIGEAVMVLGNTHRGLRNREKAIAAFREAGALADAIGDDRGRALALIKLAVEMDEATSEGKALVEQASIAAQRQPDDDELQYTFAMGVGVNRWKYGRFEEAETSFRKASEVAQRGYGENSWRVAMALSARSAVAGAASRPEEALALNERALSIYRQSAGREVPGIVTLHLVSADLLVDLLRANEAEAHLREALRIAERELSEKSFRLAGVLDALGHALTEQGRFREALPLHTRALAMQEQRPEAAMSCLLGIGRSHLGMRAPREAIPSLERAVRTAHEAGKNMVHADTELALADALRQAKRDPRRARELLAHARDVYRGGGRTPRHARNLARIEALLAGPP